MEAGKKIGCCKRQGKREEDNEIGEQARRRKETDSYLITVGSVAAAPPPPSFFIFISCSQEDTEESKREIRIGEVRVDLFLSLAENSGLAGLKKSENYIHSQDIFSMNWHYNLENYCCKST